MVKNSFFGFYSPRELWNSDKQYHSRLVAHKVYVGDILNHSWRKRTNDSICQGNLELKCIFDIGQIVKSLKTGEQIFEEEIIKKYKIHYFEDGSYIIGEHRRKKSVELDKGFFEKYFDLAFDLDNFQCFNYNLSIKNNILSEENMFMFLVKNYVIIDGKEVFFKDAKFNLIRPIKKDDKIKMIKILRKTLPKEFENILR